MTRHDEAAVGELGLGVDGDNVADIHAQSQGVGPPVDHGVDPQFDLTPIDGLIVHLFVEGVPGGLQGEDRSAIASAFREDGAARALGEA